MGRRENRVRKPAAPIRRPPSQPPRASKRRPPSTRCLILSYSLLLYSGLRRRGALFFGLCQSDVTVDADDLDVRSASPDAGAVTAVSSFVFIFLDVRQIGFDSAVMAA